MIYTLFQIFGFAVAFLYIIFFANKFKIKKFKGILLIVFAYGAIYAIMMLLYYVISGQFGGRNMIRVFIIIPFVVIFFAQAFGINKKRALDYIAPLPIMVFGITHFGCPFSGCCYSNIEVAWGIFNKYTQTTLFPIQLVEGTIAVLMTVFLILLLKKNKYDMQGRAMPYMLIMYGFSRFLLEFFRGNEKLFLGISELALWALATGLFGLGYIIFLNIKEKKKNGYKIG